jgi:hypothetical protein
MRLLQSGRVPQRLPAWIGLIFGTHDAAKRIDSGRPRVGPGVRTPVCGGGVRPLGGGAPPYLPGCSVLHIFVWRTHPLPTGVHLH